MKNWIDLKELKAQLDFAHLLIKYGVELHTSKDQHHGFCPLPLHKGHRNSSSFSANLRKGIWQCFGCGQKGNVLDFAVLMEGGNPKDGKDVQRIASVLRDEFLNGRSTEKTPIDDLKEQNASTVINSPLDFELKGLDKSHPYLVRRGFEEQTIAHFALGYCTRGLLRNRIVIPIHDRIGNLVGYAGRVVDDKAVSKENPKYRFPGSRERKGLIHEFRKSLLVYNAYRFSNSLDDLVVVEGFASVWWLWQAGIENVVGTMGASCSEEQADVLVSLVSDSGRVWILTDGDSAGERCAISILVRVGSKRFTRWTRVEAGRQPTSFSPLELRHLLGLPRKAKM